MTNDAFDNHDKEAEMNPDSAPSGRLLPLAAVHVADLLGRAIDCLEPDLHAGPPDRLVARLRKDHADLAKQVDAAFQPSGLADVIAAIRDEERIRDDIQCLRFLDWRDQCRFDDLPFGPFDGGG